MLGQLPPRFAVCFTPRSNPERVLTGWPEREDENLIVIRKTWFVRPFPNQLALRRQQVHVAPGDNKILRPIRRGRPRDLACPSDTIFAGGSKEGFGCASFEVHKVRGVTRRKEPRSRETQAVALVW